MDRGAHDEQAQQLPRLRVRSCSSLFQDLVFDPDKQQIVDFRLHPWADQYLMLRAELYGGDDDGSGTDVFDDEDENEENENRFTTLSSDEAIVNPQMDFAHSSGITQDGNESIEERFRDFQHIGVVLRYSKSRISSPQILTHQGEGIGES